MYGRMYLPLSLCLAALLWPNARAAETPTPIAQWIPQDAVITVEILQPKAFMDRFLDEKAVSAYSGLPVFQKQGAAPGYNPFFQVIKYLEIQLATDWRTGMGRLTGGGVALAFCPQQRNVLIADSTDERFLAQLHDVLWKATLAKAVSAGQPSPASSQKIGDVTAWMLSPTEAHALLGKRLVAAGNLEGIKAVLALRDRPQPAGLAATPAYQAAKRAVGPDALGMVFLNMEILRQVPAISRVLKPDKPNPLAALLLAGIADGASQAKWLALGLHTTDKGLALRLVSDSATTNPTSPAAFALPEKSDAGALPNLTVPRQIAALSLYRDLHRFYRAKDQLFPERTSELIFFENMMGIFFSGRELTDDVMALAKPEIRFVVAGQEYDTAIGTPEVQIPAFAAVLQLRDPENFTEVVEEAWQKAIGLSSFTRGQQAVPGFSIERPVHAGIAYSVARFSSLGIKDRSKIDARFNFRPSLAMPGNYLILSSTDVLARDLMDAVLRESRQPVQPASQIHSLMEISGKRLAAAVQANRTLLIRQNMLKEATAEEAAASSFDALIGLAGLVDSLRLTIGTQGGVHEGRLEMNLAWLSSK